jgi:outer membrane protein assembly factor BamC
VTSTFLPTATRAAVAAFVLSLTGCSLLDTTSDDALQYQAGARKVPTLVIPPDLSGIAPDGRYQTQSGSVSAAALKQQQAASQVAAGVPAAISPIAQGDWRLERQGQARWLVSPRSPESLWPQLRQFWLDLGFTLEVEDQTTGVIQTNWAENRAKLPNNFIRQTIGGLIDTLSDTGERDRYRMRIERTAQGGTEVYVTHHGLQEVYREAQVQGQTGDTTWTVRPRDPQMEAEVLTRMLVRLGGVPLQAGVPGSPASVPEVVAPVRARTLANQETATVQVDDTLERTWRRLGLALDRGGFTVEERQRSNAVYTVRYIDPKEAAKTERGFWARLFSSEAENTPIVGQYRIQIGAEGERVSRVRILTPQGAPDNSANAQRIATLLADELK